ncbi:hypothetical protein BLL52_1155 [Rhodoferax antarcticus ANT.BR]|uniref:Right handed beta helix domain-containing protein n=1 Tax=Rhodoferax antarcticus ANT.BR TaxID=1111071 RepID=A0A1Q8YH59_9BURK|nr:hypothetical protein RA876_00480 [Rhodoferax antarcticus]OLP07325.1 hypothetical protein BLL52_1155 [Rhodoferax antarcticus ANT.BR]
MQIQSGTKTFQVGPQRNIKTIAEAARLVKPGTTIEVDSGVYAGDVAVWQRDNITLRAVGGRVRLQANGAAAEGKGIWVVRAKGMRVEGFDFEGAIVPSRNGAGIRLDSGSLIVKDCGFFLNEIGLLTNNDPDTVLEVEDSEFAYNMRPDGHNHNLYVGAIARLSVTGSYFHHATVGHLLKSRAAVNHIFYNRLTDEDGGRASYELEFPNGGVAYVVGNQIQQGPGTENRTLISFGAEGYIRANNALYLVGNTLVDDFGSWGQWLAIRPPTQRGPNGTAARVTVKAMNNLLVGGGQLKLDLPADLRNNVNVSKSVFVDPTRHDYRLRNPAHPPMQPVDPDTANGVDLRPKREYVPLRQTRDL